MATRDSGGEKSRGLEMKDRHPRFQVNRVSTVDDADEEELAELYDEEDDSPGSYVKSFRHFTREALPRMDNYRNIMSIQAAYRPTLDELHQGMTLHGKNATVVRMNGVSTLATEAEGAVKFGWIKGVLVRNLLNIWGVMLFLRLSWVVAQAGIVQGVLLIFATSVVTFITALSMSAISTNGLVKGGGTYFMISRSLGPEFGGSIGLILSLANAISAAMNCVGFTESLLDLFSRYDIKIIDGGLADTRIIGCITITVLLGVVCVGMEWEAKTQMGLLVILLVAICDFLIGAVIGPTSDRVQAQGFVGWNATVAADNMLPDYRMTQGTEHNFYTVFAVFFPAAAGFLAGANISGDLRDPQTAIPKGTLLSILITTVSYMGMAVIVGCIVLRDASGNVEEFFNGTFTDCLDRKCDYGLHNGFSIMELVSVFGPLIYAGCFAATLSSALASLVSAPKVFQALCNDKLYPYIEFFGKGYGRNNEPVRGYVLTFFIAIIFILIGQLNAIAPLISNFFLAAYALINFSTFHASLVKPVGWRPTFKYYNMWLSLAGAMLCVAVMFLISWWTALLTMAFELFLYLIVAYRKTDVNWGSSTQAQIYRNALGAVQQLNKVQEHVKNYQPQILVLSALPSCRPPLVDFASLMTKNSLLICGHILSTPVPHRVRYVLNQKARNWLDVHKIKGFYNNIDDSNFEDGASSLMQTSGLGKMRPNILLMGYKMDWRTCDRADLAMYFNIMHKALDLHLSVSILRLKEGLDYSKIITDEVAIVTTEAETTAATSFLQQLSSQDTLPRNESFISTMSQVPRNTLGDSSSDLVSALLGRNYAVSEASDVTPPGTPAVTRNPLGALTSARGDTDNNKTESKKEKRRDSRTHMYLGLDGQPLSKNIVNNLSQFQKNQKKGVIDVWWLYDDGGLTLLLPYIISTRHNWSDCKLRVFTLANKKDELQYEQRNMASLLAKFRIDYSDLKVIPDITKKPQDETVAQFESLIKELKISDDDEDGVHITDAELLAMRDKTNRHLRLRELLLEHSTGSNLIVMTLPMPRKNVVTAMLYMSWLEVISRDMPPFLFVRGNQQSVLTFYS
ncbi:solute carrier family 12 member 1-like [Macrosteles quadrilineatus]|uniref:solute carrier family 12 member 1-like n=1 Tax=Macrosteles quadrilineatus TaxID=74068 RepID=UPI0023E0D0CA|nr:solute carrier family 12 member 1-like isoform X2 [Macrosteles quadrilineatus]XP_054285856.1 solute carrier family 12 member 1-like [Macrosteles quadrilineatus]